MIRQHPRFNCQYAVRVNAELDLDLFLTLRSGRYIRDLVRSYVKVLTGLLTVALPYLDRHRLLVVVPRLEYLSVLDRYFRLCWNQHPDSVEDGLQAQVHWQDFLQLLVRDLLRRGLSLIALRYRYRVLLLIVMSS